MKRVLLPLLGNVDGVCTTGLLGVLICVLTCGLHSVALGASKSPYVLIIKKSQDSEVLRLSQRASGRTLWTRKITFHSGKPGWSPDGRAVALEVGGGVQILTWREGKPLQVYDSSKLGYDYSMGFAWAPDKRRLLLRIGGSGSADVDLGILYCLDLDSGRFTLVGNRVRKFQWAGRRKVLFWTGKPQAKPPYTIIVSKTPTAWWAK